MNDSQKLSMAHVLTEKRAMGLDETRFMGMVEKEFGTLPVEDMADIEAMVSDFMADRF